MGRHFESEHVKAPSWEYDGDTGDVVYPNLFPEDEPSTIDYTGVPGSTDQSLSLDTDDGGFTTITNLVAEGIRSKSTFEVVDVETSSYCALESLRSGTNVTSDYGEAVMNTYSSSENSPSFPDGAIVDHPFDQYKSAEGRYNDSPAARGALVLDEDQSVDDRSTALSSLTNNESMFLRWLTPKDRMDMLFDPFRDAMRPPPFDETNGLSREISGLNRLIVSSARNLSSIFRPRPHPEFHLNHKQSAPVISTTSTPENLVITTTHSRITPSVCSTNSEVKNRSSQNSSQAHSVSQLFNNDVRERYGAAVMRSYQSKYPPVILNASSSSNDNGKQRRCRLLSMITLFALVLCVAVSVTLVKKNAYTSSEEYVSNSADKHRQGDGSLPSACCIDDMQHLDEIPAEAENIDLKEEHNAPILEHAIVALPAATNVPEYISGSTESLPQVDLEEDTGSPEVILASSQNDDQSTASHFTSIDGVASPWSPSSSLTIPSQNIFSSKLGSETDAPTSTISPTQIVTAASFIVPNPTRAPLTKQPVSNRPSTKQPSKEPSNKPTRRPTRGPRTIKPSNAPSPRPTSKPHVPSIPVTSTYKPTDSPSLSPVHFPTFMPSSIDPTEGPSYHPITTAPSSAPSEAPLTSSPTHFPSAHPVTAQPVILETESPSRSPIRTAEPSRSPTMNPITFSPSKAPTANPSTYPTSSPSTSPLTSPTNGPTLSPSIKETDKPTGVPSMSPISTPTAEPSVITPQPSPHPIPYPSINPTDSPTYKPVMTLAPVSPPTPFPFPEPIPNPTPDPTSYVTADCVERKFSFSLDEGCSNIIAGGEYDILNCCVEYYGSFDNCVYIDVCGVYTYTPIQQPSPEPTLIETIPMPDP